MDQLAGLDRLQCRDARGHMFKKVIYFRRPGANNEDCYLAASEVLLILYALVKRHENIEFPFSQAQQLAIFLACKSSFGNSLTFVSVGRERGLQETRHALVKQ